MLSLVKLLLALAGAAALGLALTFVSVENGPAFGVVRDGAWTMWSDVGAQEPTPYTRSAIARDGLVPLGVGEGLAFTARVDATGQALSGACAYAIDGPFPPGRTWTLTLTTPDGRLVDNPARRYGFTAAEVLRDPAGRFAIRVGPSARPGNWLPTGRAGPFVLVLKVYDTPLAAARPSLRKVVMPAIVRQGCR